MHVLQALCRSECAVHPCPQLVLASCTALVAGGGITTERIFKHNPPPELVDRLAAAAGKRTAHVGFAVVRVTNGVLQGCGMLAAHHSKCSHCRSTIMRHKSFNGCLLCQAGYVQADCSRGFPARNSLMATGEQQTV